ncbi:MAG: PilZ domain-containing protein [Candidatus Omnitrophica bacterium]|nr:PilZ domain-containing protein [Candidatus Omnitrophota bacterium]
MPGLKTSPSIKRRQESATLDRRIFARLPIKLSARILNPLNGSESDAETVDISANGVGLQMPRGVSSGTPLELWLRIPDMHEPLYSRGEVVWTQPVAGYPLQRAGIALERAHLMGLARILWIQRNQNSN